MSAAVALSKLGLKQMVIAALAREGITTEQQLREAGRDALSQIPGIGRSRLAHIYQVFDDDNSVAIHQTDSTTPDLPCR